MLYNKSKGFSLIELSVVVIIISLLAASVMGGAKLVKSAKISAVIKEIAEIKTAIDAFEIKYAALPGDFAGSSALWSPDCVGDDGDGNKKLTSFDAHAIGHLYYADLLPRLPVDNDTSVTISGDICTNGQFYPSAVMKIAYRLHGLTDVLTLTSAFGTTDLYRSFIVTDGIGSDFLIDATHSALSTNNAHNIDLKMDDGIPDKGQVASNQVSPASGCLSGSTYNLTTEGKVCTMFFRFR